MKTKTLALLVSSVALSGCMATLQPMIDNVASLDKSSSSTPEQNTDVALLDRNDKPITEWNPSVLRNAETIFVPAVFSATQKGQLYIKGQQVLFNNLPQADVLGFIRGAKKNTYIVAVASPRKLVQVNNRSDSSSLLDPDVLNKLSPQEQLRMMEAAAVLQRSQAGTTSVANTQSVNNNGFYVAIFEVDSSRKILRELKGFETLIPEAWVGKDGIFVATPAPGGHGRVNYQGYSPLGKTASGPSNVLWASPSENPGLWYFYRPDPRAGESFFLRETDYQWGSWSLAEGFKVETSAALRHTSFMQFVNTTGIYVNTPPVADTARTGAATFVFSQGNSDVIYTKIISSYIHVYRFGAPKPTRKQIDCFGLCNHEITLISHRNIQAASSDNGSAVEAGRAALYFAKRGFLTGKGESVMYFNQNETSGFGSLVFGGLSTVDKEPPVVLDVINGAGINSVRKYLFAGSGNTDAFSRSKNAYGVPYFTVDSIQPLVMVHSRLESKIAGVDLSNGQLITNSGYTDSASQFGIELK